MKTCPECAEDIKLEAKVCRYCGTTFTLTRVGYCIRCHKVVAANDLGVCAICGSRLIDVRLESSEVSGPTIGAEKKEAAPAGAAAAAPFPGAVAPVVPVEEPGTAEHAMEEAGLAAPAERVPEAKEEPEAEEELVAKEAEAEAKPAEPEVKEPEPVAKPPEPEVKPPEPVAEQPTPPEPELPAAPTPPPGPPPGVAWAKKEPVAEAKPPEKVPEAEAAVPGEAALTPKPPPITTSEAVAERLAAFGRREPVAPAPPPPPAGAPPAAPPPGPPVTPPPGPPGGIPVRPPVGTTPPAAPPSAAPPPVTPVQPVAPAPPVSGPGAGAPPAAAAAPPVKPAEPGPEVVAEKPKEEKPAKEKVEEPVVPAGMRLGIVPSLAQRAAYPFYLLAVIAVLAMWLINYYWDHNLQGTTKTGAQTLSHFVIDTYDGGMTLVSWQLGGIAILCALLIPLRLLPKGWFRERGVAKEFTKELRAELGVDMIFQQKWYFQKMMLALALWAIAIGYLVATIVRKGSITLQTGGYVTIAALLVGFACSAILATRRKQLVAVDEAGRIRH